MKLFIKSAINEIMGIAKREMNYYCIKPTYALLFMTYRCTSRCSICAMWQKKVNIKEELSLEEWQHIINDLNEMGVYHIEFFGGDALLRKDIIAPLISYAHNKNIYTEMPTNCNLLDDNMAVELVNAGLDDIWISLDGVKTVHDRVRGRDGTFDKVDRALKAIHKAKADKPRIFINCVITKYNLNSFEEIILYAKERGVFGIDFEYVGEITSESVSNTEINGMHPSPFFMTTGDSSSVLNKDEASLLKSKLEDIKRNRTSNRIRINTSKIDMLSIEDIISGRFPNKRCYICRNWLTVDPFGNVIGCLHFNNYLMGNLKEKTLSSIWKGHKHIEFINARDNGLFDICNYCSNGAIRNNTPLQTLRSMYYKIMKTKIT